MPVYIQSLGFFKEDEVGQKLETVSGQKHISPEFYAVLHLYYVSSQSPCWVSGKNICPDANSL